MIKVSVVIPVYNVEKYLPKCLESIINQTLKDIEIICINDGSKDNSAAILLNYAKKDKRIRIINQENKGAGAARNRGLEIASGDYLYFIDSDDWADKKLLEKLYCKITKNNSDICICKTLYADENSIGKFRIFNMLSCFSPLYFFKDLCIKNRIYNRNNSPKNLFQLCNIPAFTKLYRHNFLKENRIKFQEIPSCNDVFFNFYSLACANSITFVNKKLVTHRIGHDSITKKRGETINCILAAFNELEKSLKACGYWENLQETFYKRAASCFKYELSQVKSKVLQEYWEKRFDKYLNEHKIENLQKG